MKKSVFSQPLVDLASLDLNAIPHSAALRLERAGASALRVRLDASDPNANLAIVAPNGEWDLSPYRYLSFDVTNEAGEELLIEVQLNNNQWVFAGDVIPAGGQGTLTLILPYNGAAPEYISRALFGMNGLPEYRPNTISKSFDIRHVQTLNIYLLNATAEHTLTITNLRVEGQAEFPSEAWLAQGFFPFVDEFAQYRHDEWPTKVHSVAELQAAAAAENDDLSAHPGEAEWDEYGGWATGPQLEATGHFYPIKHEGRWWLVDPHGRLFWSHGIDSVAPDEITAVTDREHYFAALPTREEHPELYSERDDAPFGHYAGRTATLFNIAAYNLLRKYGPGWPEVFADRTHRRLRSWGLNTIGAWAEELIYLQRRTPYTIYIPSRGRSIEGTEGQWRKFPDPFDAGWRQHLAQFLAEQQDKSANDPYCIGYFVDNELSWGHDTYLARGALRSPADQPAKLAFREYLQAKYGSIEALNRAWRTNLADWGAFLAMTEVPEGIDDDLRAFNVRIAEQYMGVSRDEIRRAAPNKLYLGARFDFHRYPHQDDVHRWAVEAAGRYADVITFNRYRYSCRELAPTPGVDKPIMVTEWHMGVLERGMPHVGLRAANSPEHQKRMYRHFVHDALANPYIVGTHWFQYGEQAISGRFDGENYRIGFIDITDQPYPALVEVAREIGHEMYWRRSGK